jgi:hypothetical protein
MIPDSIQVFLTVVWFVGVTYLFGFLYKIVCTTNRRFILSTGGWGWFCLSAFIGVPFHEISHLVLALIFGHDITEIKLFRPIAGKRDGNLGYVHYRFNHRSLYQNMGNFFVGAAPMLFGGGLLLTILLIGFSDCIDLTSGNMAQTAVSALTIFSGGKLFRGATAVLIITALLICPHLGMSKADFKCAATGTLALLGAALVIPFYLTSWKNWLTYTQIICATSSFMIYYTYALVLGLIISVAVTLFNGLLSVLTGGKKYSGN